MSNVIYLFLALAGCSACGDRSLSHLKTKSPTEYNILGDVSLDSSRHIKLGIPTSDLPQILISRQQYLLSYNEQTRDLNWVAWELKSEDLGTVKRTDKFSLDPDLAFAHIDAVDDNEYLNSCFDRGHQTPSADRTASQLDNEVTFYMSNMLPQTAYLNRVIWLSLENEERRLVREENQTLYIYAGPIFENTDHKIGPNKDIKVPTKNFKIIADESGKVLAAAIMPNITSTGLDPFEDHSQACKDSKSLRPTEQKVDAWKEYNSTLLNIQKLSGIDFGFIND